MEIYYPHILYPGMREGLGVSRSPLGYKFGRRVNYYAIRFYSIIGSDNYWSPDDPSGPQDGGYDDEGE